ncbi:MAG: hypothetical protein Q8M65_00645 [Rhodoglobus sp.]|nr:hypothetical protein [Rhodoglobus sp.]
MTYYERSLEALDCLDSVGRAGRSRLLTGMSVGEVSVALAEMRTELDLEVSLALMAGAEALLRVDYRNGVRQKLRTPSAARRRFKSLWSESEERAPLEAILAIWKDEVGHPDRFAAFGEYLQLRHWLAHGRHWGLKMDLYKSSRRAEPQDVLQVLDDLFSTLPDFRA